MSQRTTPAAETGDVRIPKLGLGTWRATGSECRRAVESALELGYRHVDTAQAYGNEREVGIAVSASDVDREDVFLTTKVRGRNARYEDVIESTTESLERLGVEYVDLLLLHWPNPLVSIAETMAAMNALRDAGTVRHVGVSNCSRSQLEEAREASAAPVVTNQVAFHPYSPRRDLLRYCQREGIVLTAYSPLAHGGMIADDLLADIGETYGKSAAQVAIRWAIQHRNAVAIPKTTSRDHLAANREVFDFRLTSEEMRAIARPSRVRSGVAMVRGRLGA